LDTAKPIRPANPATPNPIPPTIAMPTKPSEKNGEISSLVSLMQQIEYVYMCICWISTDITLFM